MRHFKQIVYLTFFISLVAQSAYSQSIDLKSLTNISTMNVVQAEKTLLNFGFAFSNIDAENPGLSIYRNKSKEEIRFSAVDKRIDFICSRASYLPIHDALMASSARFNEAYLVFYGDFVYVDLKHIYTIKQNFSGELDYKITIEKN